MKIKKQKPQHISKFNKGDLLIRLNPVNSYWIEYDEILEKNIKVEFRGKDASYIGIPLKYMRIVGDKINFEWFSENKIFDKGETLEVNYENFQEGWFKYHFN